MAISTERRSVLIALLVAVAYFMENLDGTVIATALPQMAVSFGKQAVDLNVGMSAYLLTLALLIPASGWVSDRFGARSVFGLAIVIFTLASVLCGFSNSLWTFTAARILQGIGGAMMVPVGRLVVLRNTPKQDLIRAIAYITWPALAAPVLGPPVGGFLTAYATWRWIFFLNMPVGLLALAGTFWLISNDTTGHRPKLDWVGFILTGFACLSFMYGLDLISRQDSDWARTALTLAAGLAVGGLAIGHAKRHPAPMLELWGLRVQSFAVTIWGGSLFRIAISSLPFLLPLLFQIAFGLNAFHAGLLVIAVFAGNLGMKPATTPILKRFGFRPTLIVTGLISAASIFACALLTPTTPIAVILAILFISGLARSMQFTTINTLAFADIPEPRMSGANTLFSAAQQMSMGMGIAAGAIALRLAALWRGSPGDNLSLGDFHLAFIAMGVFALAALADAYFLPANAGANLSKR